MTEHVESPPYTTTVASLLTPRLAALGPGEPNLPLGPRLAELSDRELFGSRAVVDRQMASACRAGLWLYHDFLDQSHQLSQEIETPTGSYWHGIMHRREPDFANANYWLRRVGRHPIHLRLVEAAGRIAGEQAGRLPPDFASLAGQPRWNFEAFTELCRGTQHGPAEAQNCCRQLQQAEWELLFDYCYHAALGDTNSSIG
ncbi:MAG TPA: hypothetical protein VHY20_07110 [Pirellulales bacterium]|nr:hypothetical protein [Pirellulales bacterium]